MSAKAKLESHITWLKGKLATARAALQKENAHPRALTELLNACLMSVKEGGCNITLLEAGDGTESWKILGSGSEVNVHVRVF
jgi:hypothetical protein